MKTYQLAPHIEKTNLYGHVKAIIARETATEQTRKQVRRMRVRPRSIHPQPDWSAA